MSSARLEKKNRLVPLRTVKAHPTFPVPGDEVAQDTGGIGIVISVNGDDCTVLWSKDPLEYDIQITAKQIYTTSRKLNVKWSAEFVDDLNAMYTLDIDKDVKC